MDKKRVCEVVEHLKRRLHDDGIAAVEIVVFGSHIRGTQHEESDLDLMIISKAFENKDIFERSEMTAASQVDVIKRFLVPLDIINLTPEEFEENPAYASMVATP
jgi:predicted nucleotidyltransferase